MSAPDLTELCAELAELYRELEHHYGRRPYAGAGPVLERSQTTPGAEMAILPTPGGDGTHRRSVPRSRPPLDLDVLVAAQSVYNGALALAAACRTALEHVTRDREPAAALASLPALVEALPEGDALRRRVPAVLDALRRRARVVLGRGDPVVQLGTPCPTSFEVLVTVKTSNGVVEDDNGCWTLDLAATTEAGDEVWRRSTLVLPLARLQPVVCCWACGYRADPRDSPELSDAVMAHLAEQGVVPAGGMGG